MSDSGYRNACGGDKVQKFYSNISFEIDTTAEQEQVTRFVCGEMSDF
jgi:hypothetical protein